MTKVLLVSAFALGVIIGWEANAIRSKWAFGNNMYNGMFTKEDY